MAHLSYVGIFVIAAGLMALNCTVPAVILAALGLLIAWRAEAALAARKTAQVVRSVPRPRATTPARMARVAPPVD